MEDYLNHLVDYLQEQFNLKSSILVYPVNAFDFLSTIVIFVQKIEPSILSKLDKETTVVCLLNTEQLTVSNYKDKVFQDVQKYKISVVVDYSEENLSLLRQRFPLHTFLHFPFPIQFHKSKECQKEYSCVSLLNSVRRKRICRGISLENFQGKWGETRDNIISKSKILLNLHHSDDYLIFESIRCYHALEMRTLIISDLCLRTNDLLLSDFIVFCRPSEIQNKIQEIEKHYEVYYQQCFSEPKMREIEKRIKDVYVRSIETLLSL